MVISHGLSLKMRTAFNRCVRLHTSPSSMATRSSWLALPRRCSEGRNGRKLHGVAVFLIGFGCGTPSWAVVAAVDPDRCQAVALCRHVVVGQALRHVQ